MKNIVFVLDNIADYNSLTQNIADAQVFVLDSKGNALSQMAAILEDYSNLDAIHLFSHGSTGGGELNLGSLTLSNANASVYSDTLSRIGSSLSSNGDILLYGCNVANGTTGIEFINKLSQITNADIAASDDLTGSSALGGDWVLEAHSGSIEATVFAITMFNDVLTDNPNTHITNPNTQLLGDINGTWPTGGVNADPGEGAYAAFTYTFTATLSNTLISFMINNDPDYVYLDNIVVYDNADANHTNLITNGAFSGGATPVGTVNIPDNWMAIGQQGLSAAGTLSSGAWYDGAVGGFDGIAQSITTTVGHTYTITFDMNSSSAGMGYSYDSANGVEVEVYAGPLPGGVSILGSANHAPTIATGSNSLDTSAASVPSTAQKVGDILGLSGTTYADSDGTTIKGIAITSTTTVGSGSWQYSADGSTGWTNFSTSAITSSMLLDQNYYVRFNASSTGGTASFTYVGWDESDGNASGSTVNATTRGNTTAFSTNTHTINLPISSAPTVTLSVDNATIAESNATATVTATLSAVASTDTTVTLAATGTATGDGTDYTLSSTTITITAGQTTGTASVTSVQDTLDEADETVIVSIDSVSGGGGATESGTQSVTVTISDDDATPTVSIADTSLSEGHAGSENMTFTATLSAASGRAVSVNYATSNGTASSGSDYTASSGTLNFAAGETTKTFTVAIWGDTNLEGNETITATLSNPTNATLGTSTATGTINDDENATPVNTVPSAQTTNEDVAKVFSTANSNAITVTDAENATLTTTVSIASGKGAFSITASGHGATVSATAISIQLEGTATQINAALTGLTYTPTANENGAGYATLTVLTSDGVTADTDTVTINVTAVDDAPVANSMAASVSLNSKQLFSTFTPSFNDVEEDSPTHLKILSMPSTGSFEVYDGDGDRSDDANWEAVTEVDSSNPLTIAMADLGDYRFNAGSNTGAANVNWAVQTNGQWSNTATGVVTIVDSSNNDTPVVNIYQANGTTSLNSGTLTVAEDGTSANVVLKFSDDITPEEFMQGIVQSSNSDIIDMSCISMVRSTTTETGDTVTLTFTPKANAYGDVTITLGASDGDKSATQTFTLSVTPTNEQAVAQDFLKTINEDGTFYFNIINPADIYADANDANMNKGVNAVDYNAQMAIIATAQQEGATEEQITAAGTAITALVNASLFPNSFLIKTLPTHGKLYLGETEITTTDYSVAIADLASLTYVPTANYSGSDSFTWQGVDVGDLATTTKTATFTVNEVNDAQTGSVTISGTPTQGQTLTASNTLADVDGLGTITYQWKADGVAIDGATGETLVLGEAHVGKVITVVASYTDDHAHAESSTSTATAAIANLNDDPTGSVIISGTATQGETLTASNTLADVDGLGTITYQWKADGEAISGATSSTFVLGEAQVGKVITVTASYTDDRGTSESSTSTTTAAIANLNDSPTGSVTISGTATQGQTLTVSNTLADLDGLGEVMSYQWKADGVAIDGATGETLVLGESHVGKIITVVASYTDGHETTESKSSSATTAVATPPPSGGGGSTPTTPTTPPATTTVDGTTVQTATVTQARTTTDASGNTTTTTVSTEQLIIAPVSVTRTDSTGTATTADVPLFWGESSRTEWATTANLPTGVGLTTAGSRAPETTATQQSALADLLYYIDTTTPSSDLGKAEMLSGGATFLSALANIQTLVVNQITLSTTNTEASQVPITITGVANTVVTTDGAIAPVEALVIDAQSLQAGSMLNLQNVEFAVIIGENLTIRGGEGQNILFTGAGSQNIMLGEDDDQLYAGDGDDTVGSAGGDDSIFGEGGDDTVFGGEGNDMLHGGSEEDVATYSGNMADYVITRDEGKTYVALASNPNEVDTLINVENIEFADSSYTIENSITLSKIATLYMHILDRQAEIDGFQYWAKDTTSLGNIALGFITSVEYKTNSGVNWETLDVSGKVEQFYEALLGRSSDEIGKAYWVDAINAGMTFEQAVEGFIDSVELSGIYQSKEDWNFSL